MCHTHILPETIGNVGLEKPQLYVVLLMIYVLLH